MPLPILSACPCALENELKCEEEQRRESHWKNITDDATPLVPPPADSVGCSTTSWRFDEKQTALRISSSLASSKVVKQCRTCKAVRYDNNKQQTTSTSNCAFLAFRLSRPRTTTTLTTTTGRVQLNRQEMLVVVFTRSLPLVVLAWFDGQLANKRAARIPAVLACPGVRRDCWRRFSKKRLRLRRVRGIRITHRHTHTPRGARTESQTCPHKHR